MIDEQAHTSDVALADLRVDVARISAQMEARFESNAQAVARASEALTIRLDHSNGLIAQMREQAQQFATRSEVGDIARRIEALERVRSANEGYGRGGENLKVIILLIVGALISFLATKLASSGP
jgi:hypothetical protein